MDRPDQSGEVEKLVVSPVKAMLWWRMDRDLQNQLERVVLGVQVSWSACHPTLRSVS